MGVIDVDFGQIFGDDDNLNLPYEQSNTCSDSKSVTSCSTLSSAGKSKKNKQIIVSPSVKTTRHQQLKRIST